MTPGADPRRPYRGGIIAGLLASLPVLGPALGALCLSCVGFGGAALAGATLSIPSPPLIAAGVAVLALSGWRSLRRARRTCGPDECRRLAARLPLLLGATALGTYLFVTFVAVPLLARAIVELSGAFSHRPTLP